MAQLKDLIVNGPSRFIGDVYATTFTGDLNGNANTATSATTAAALTGKTLVTASAVTTSNWPTYGNNHIPTMSFMAYWNGAYSGTSSNLTYCAQGTIIGSNNIGNQSVKYATTSGSCNGNAATATKATQDGNGNIITSTYLPLSGGTINGNLKIGAIDNISYKYLVLFRSGHFARINNTEKDAFFAFGTVSDTGVLTAEKVLKIGDNGIQYSPDISSYYDILHAGNLTSYAPSLTGSGATGTWGINISGNAATATNATNAGYATDASYATRAGSALALTAERFDSDAPTPNSKNGLTFQFSYNLGSGASGWWNVLNMRSYIDNNYTSSQIITPADNPGTDTGYSGDMKWRQGRNSTWLDWKTLLDSNNYTTYCTPANIGAAPSNHTHTKSQITDFPSSLPASDVKAWAKADTKPSYIGTEVTLSGYSKNNSYTPIASGDSVQAAVAKLEGAISGLETLLASI